MLFLAIYRSFHKSHSLCNRPARELCIQLVESALCHPERAREMGNEDCPGAESELAGKSDAYEGCHNQQAPATTRIGPPDSVSQEKMNLKRVTESDDSQKLSTPPVTATGCGLVIIITDTIRTFLMAASSDSNLSEHLRDLSSSSVIMHSTIPYKSLKMIWFGSKLETRPNLSSLLSGSNFIFTSPKPREKSEELKARLRKLEEAAERKAYQEFVKDITPKKEVEEPFSSYKDQLGFGLHVVLTMFTGYLLGYAAFKALFGSSPAMNAAGGIVGLVGAMLVETLLFILRASYQDRRSTPSGFASSTLKEKKNQ